MDINSINNSLNNLNNVQQQGLDKSTGVQETSKITNDEALKVTISEVYQKQRDELSQSLQNLNEGIAITEIAKQGLQKQEEILKGTQENLYKISTDESIQKDADEIKTDIAKNLQAFNQVAQETTYKNEKILVSNDERESHTISTKKDAYTIDPINTQAISSSLAQNIYNNPLQSNDDYSKAIGDIQQAVDLTRGQYENFSKLEQKIENSARDTITEQIELSRQNSKLKDVDFGAEVTDFSKTNITTNLGFLVGSQANIVQEQSVRLISK